MEKYCTTKEIAQMLKVHPRTIMKHISNKTLRASKIGVGWKIGEKDLRKFIECRANINRPIGGD